MAQCRQKRLRRTDSYTGKECGRFSLLPEFQYRSWTKQEAATGVEGPTNSYRGNIYSSVPNS